MSHMNCKYVQELLPLYVGCDLEEKRSKPVMEHLESCAECAGSANEYRETRQLLQQFEPPPFSEEVFAGIRQHVLREIGRESAAPTLPQLVAKLFRPRITWAVSAALLLAVSLFAFYFIAKPGNERPQVADSRTVDGMTQDDHSNSQSQGDESAVSSSSPNKENDGPPLKSTGGNTIAETMIAGSFKRAYQSQGRKSPRAAVDPKKSVARPPDTRSMAAKAAPESNNLNEPDAVAIRDSATTEKTLRVEMQTKDRNIRIIWFSHQPTKQDFRSKFSKGI
jgi:hypothetical protein